MNLVQNDSVCCLHVVHKNNCCSFIFRNRLGEVVAQYKYSCFFHERTV